MRCILPLLCAFAVGLTLGPLIKVAERRGVPPWVMAIILVLLMIAAANLAVVMLAGPVSSLVAQAPKIGAAFAEKLHIFDRPLAALDELQTALGLDADKSMSFSPARIIEGILTTVTPAALQFILAVMLFFATLFFFILGRAGFRNHAINWFTDREARAARAQDHERHREATSAAT